MTRRAPVAVARSFKIALWLRSPPALSSRCRKLSCICISKARSDPPRCSNCASATDGWSLAPEVEQLYNYKDFKGFLTAFKDVTGHLRAPEDYELIVYRLMERLKAQKHSPCRGDCFGRCLSLARAGFPAIFEGLERGRQSGEKDFGISLLWIFDAVRQFGAEKAQSVLDLAIQFRDRNVAAFGIGGDERAGPAEWFAGVRARRRTWSSSHGACRRKCRTGLHLGRAQLEGGTHWTRPYRRTGCGVDRRVGRTPGSHRNLRNQQSADWLLRRTCTASSAPLFRPGVDADPQQRRPGHVSHLAG
jgi:hypothetical protein